MNYLKRSLSFWHGVLFALCIFFFELVDVSSAWAMLGLFVIIFIFLTMLFGAIDLSRFLDIHGDKLWNTEQTLFKE